MKGASSFLLIFLFLFFEKGWADTTTLFCLYEGPIDNAFAIGDTGGALAVQFTPPAYPAIVDSVQIYIISEGDTFWPWPDSIHQPFQVSIFEDGGGFPGNEIFTDTLLANDIPPSWVMAYPNVTILSGDFFLAHVNLSSFPEIEGVAIDSNSDNGMRNWFRVNWSDTTWGALPPWGDLLMCAYVTYPTGLEEDPHSGDRTLKPSTFYSKPNPSSGSVKILYEIPEPASINLSIYNLSGRLIRVLADGVEGAGEHRILWDGRDEKGEDLTSGIYFYRISTSGGYTQTRKLLLIR